MALHAQLPTQGTSNNVTETSSTAPTPPADPAVDFLAPLLPVEPTVRKRAFGALLRALVSERS